MKKENKDPLISVNWDKLGNFFLTVYVTIVFVIEWIIKLILNILIIIMRVIYATYQWLKKFATSNKKGVWILLLIFIIGCLLKYGLTTLADKNRAYEELYFFHNEQMDEVEKIINEKIKLQIELEETKEKLEAKLNKPVTIASAKIVNKKPLPEELKEIIAKHADEYGVSRKYCECIIALESGGRSEAVGDSGKAVGVAQYHLRTYLADAKRAGLPVQDDRKDPEKSIIAMIAALSRGEDSKWSVSPSCI